LLKKDGIITSAKETKWAFVLRVIISQKKYILSVGSDEIVTNMSERCCVLVINFVVFKKAFFADAILATGQENLC
jgi:hypothetical protein